MLIAGLAWLSPPWALTTPMGRRARGLATAGAVLAIASPSVVGHSRAYPPQLLVVAE